MYYLEIQPHFRLFSLIVLCLVRSYREFYYHPPAGLKTLSFIITLSIVLYILHGMDYMYLKNMRFLLKKNNFRFIE